MSLYYNRTTFQIDDKPDSVIQAWTEANNPKLNDWLPMPDKPTHDAATQHAPVWGDGVWVVNYKTVEEIAAEYTAAYPPAENYQVRAWMIRGGMNPDAVPAIIATVVPESVPGGINRAEALMRWDYAVRVPRNFPLVNVIGAQMDLTPEEIDTAWPDILKL